MTRKRGRRDRASGRATAVAPIAHGAVYYDAFEPIETFADDLEAEGIRVELC